MDVRNACVSFPREFSNERKQKNKTQTSKLPFSSTYEIAAILKVFLFLFFCISLRNVSNCPHPHPWLLIWDAFILTSNLLLHNYYFLRQHLVLSMFYFSSLLDTNILRQICLQHLSWNFLILSFKNWKGYWLLTISRNAF